MPESYKDKFNVLENFKSTELQDIFIATTKDESASGAVVNIIKDAKAIGEIDTGLLGECLENLLYLEKQDQELVIVTKVTEAEPMIIYLEENYVPIKGRMDLAFQYLSNILKYHALSNTIKYSLFDEAQLVVKDGKLLIDELIILHEENQITEVDLVRKVAEVLRKILFFEYQEIRQEELLLEEVRVFIDSLTEKPESMELKEIFSTFRKLYIYHYCMEGIDPEINVPKKKREMKSWPIVAVLALIVLTLGTYGLLNLIPEETGSKDPKNPKNPIEAVAQPGEEVVPAFSMVEKSPYWEFINETPGVDEDRFEAFLWEVIYQGKVIQSAETKNVTLSFTQGGTYTISLKVKEKNGEWSAPYAQEFEINIPKKEEVKADPKESEGDGELYTLSIEGQNNIILDQGKNYGKTPVYQLINDENLVPTFTLGDFNGRAFEGLSMVLTSSQKELVNIKVAAMSKGKVIHRAAEEKQLENKGAWETVSFNLPQQEIIEEIKLEIKGFQQPIWVGQITLDPVK